jgi:hypothetical protein
MFWQTPQADSARTASMIASLTSLSVTVSSTNLFRILGILLQFLYQLLSYRHRKIPIRERK